LHIFITKDIEHFHAFMSHLYFFFREWTVHLPIYKLDLLLWHLFFELPIYSGINTVFNE
jgi:hypothetical protein